MGALRFSCVLLLRLWRTHLYGPFVVDHGAGAHALVRDLVTGDFLAKSGGNLKDWSELRKEDKTSPL